MAGNTRGKLKEHFEGIHRDFDWSLHHINVSLSLIVSQITEQERAKDITVTDEMVLEVAQKHPLFIGIKALGEGIQTLDNLAQQVYEKL